MKIPKKDVVKFVVKSVLRRRTAGTQSELTVMVNKELRKVDPGYAISGKRLRGIVVSMPEVRIHTDTKKGGLPKRCPSCGSSLRKSWNRNLRGRKVLERLKCPKCGYGGHDGKWKPRKYGFRIEARGR